MANLKKKKNSKQTKTLLVVLGVLVLGGGFFLLRSGEESEGISVSNSSAINASIEKRKKAVEIRKDLFEDGLLDSLRSYNPIEPARQKGRSNPFSEYVIQNSATNNTPNEPEQQGDES